VVDEKGRIRELGFTDGHERMQRGLAATDSTRAKNPGGITQALEAYFDGELDAIEGLPVVLGGTEFQNSVWRGLLKIPCGETRSYGDLARKIGRPSAVRAVGLANGANPIGIVVPCHRVIGSNGTLTGYGGGIERKRWLLAHEHALEEQESLPFGRAAGR
jgi:O-6-methylguanine DNA methyltransferase